VLIVERWPNLKNFAHDLEMDEEHWVYIDEAKQEGVSVVLMDAYHCPGAVMFLFKGKMGTVLHTGDFRFDEKMLQHELLCPAKLKKLSMKGITVDVDFLHLDNTFADPSYDFPSRKEAYEGLVDIVKSHKEYRIFLFSYSLGKEEVFMSLANDFDTQIVVDDERMKKVRLMNLSPEKFTTDSEKSLFHIKSIKDLNTFDINQCNKEFPTIFVILTGWNDKYNKNLPFYFVSIYCSVLTILFLN
jgi:DNA cross-link repair 1B protein